MSKDNKDEQPNKIYSPYVDDNSSYWERCKKTILRRVILRTLAITAFSALIVALWDRIGIKLGIKSDFVTVITFVVSLLLAYRTNRAYDRYWEGRCLWATMITTIRDFARFVLVNVPPKVKMDAEKNVVFDLLKGFAFATKDYLREIHNETPGYYSTHLDVKKIFDRKLEKSENKPNPDGKNIFNRELRHLIPNVHSKKELEGRNLIYLQEIIEYNLPLEFALYLNYYISQCEKVDVDNNDKVDKVESTVISKMYNDVSTLVDCLTSLEKVLRSPIHYAYGVHLLHTTWIFCLSLPFQLVEDLGWVTVPIVFLTSFILLGVDKIADEIENPFGKDPNDIEIDIFCAHTEKELKFIKDHGIEEDDKNMKHWWNEAIKNAEKKHAVENPAKKNASKQETDEIKIYGKKSNDEKVVNQYGDDSSV
ncbi:15433_t:CDS:2 [Cetraspora pellucida]|uniref:15433_t:CDS:1 n=1 Tax=Cetraspora pellucida TaxID=1433469 RepID=A0A9N8ZQ95_9GLOM|nr:15433_t:CDS:2 [Cetraspora pellucida]